MQQLKILILASLRPSSPALLFFSSIPSPPASPKGSGGLREKGASPKGRGSGVKG